MVKKRCCSVITLGLLLILSACGSKPATTEEISSATATSTHPPTEAIISPPEYIDESKYSGDKLEIVKLINLRVRYLYEENLSEYRKLMWPTSPVNPDPNDDSYPFPRYKIKKVHFRDDIKITEQNNVFQGVVPLEEQTYDDENNIMSFVYVVLKGKKPDDKWMILDID
jgi:hypothetical protein